MAQYGVQAEYTAEDGLDDLEIRGPFETLEAATVVFDDYRSISIYRDVTLFVWETGKPVA